MRTAFSKLKNGRVKPWATTSNLNKDLLILIDLFFILELNLIVYLYKDNYVTNFVPRYQPQDPLPGTDPAGQHQVLLVIRKNIEKI